MAAALGALLALLAPVSPLQVTVPSPRTVALLFQPVLLRCHFRLGTPGPPPIVTWKYKSFCPSPSGDSRGTPGDTWGTPGDTWGTLGGVAGACPDSARTVRIVATKQGDAVTLGDFYRGRDVTIRGGAELSLGPASWGDSGLYVCTVTSTSDLQGNNEAVAELVVLDWLFVVLVALGAGLVALGVGLCWCQCCPHTCCCYLRCPCCPQTCCCPENLYLAGKAATSGGVAFFPSPHPALALAPLGSSRSSEAPLLRDGESTAPPGPAPSVLRYLEQNLRAWDTPTATPTATPREPPTSWGPGPAPSDVSSLHEPPWSPAPSPSPPRARWRSEELLGGGGAWGGGGGAKGSPLPHPAPPPRSRSRDDLGRGGGEGSAPPPPRNPPGAPRRLRKNDALSRESLVV